MISYKSGKEGNLIISYWESVVNQNKKYYRHLYEGKSNSMHTFWCAFYFWLESYPYEWKLPKYSLLFWKLGPCLAVSEEGKTKPVMLETSLFPYAHWQERSCLGNAFWLMNRGESIHTWNINRNISAHTQVINLVLRHPLACICSKGSLLQWSQYFVSLCLLSANTFLFQKGKQARN